MGVDPHGNLTVVTPGSHRGVAGVGLGLARQRVGVRQRCALFHPKFRSRRVKFHGVATPICDGIGIPGGRDFNCGAVVANQAQTRS